MDRIYNSRDRIIPGSGRVRRSIAERLWSPRDTTDVSSMYARLAIVSQDLAYTGIPFRATSSQMLKRLAGNENLAALKVLASVVEPPKEYVAKSSAATICTRR